jgi:single-strand DNA-binding protein
MSSITIQGLVATTPRHIITQEGLPITSFRLAEHDPKDPNGTTNWYTITAFNDLGVNTATSVFKGHRVVVSGAVNVRDWDNGERTGTSVEIEATAIGHDLNFGVAEFVRKEPAPQHTCNCDNCGKRE